MKEAIELNEKINVSINQLKHYKYANNIILPAFKSVFNDDSH